MMDWVARLIGLDRHPNGNGNADDVPEQTTIDLLHSHEEAAYREANRLRLIRERLTAAAFPFTGPPQDHEGTAP